MTTAPPHPSSYPVAPGNFMSGRLGHIPQLIVVHIMDGTLVGTDAWFANPVAGVSAHYGIGSTGEVHKYVRNADTAYHSGNWEVNLKSFGIEHEGFQKPGQPDWIPTEKQFQTSLDLAEQLCKAYGITPSAKTIIPHSQVNPKHARCPGKGFPLAFYIQSLRERLKSDRSGGEENVSP